MPKTTKTAANPIDSDELDTTTETTSEEQHEPAADDNQPEFADAPAPIVAQPTNPITDFRGVVAGSMFHQWRPQTLAGKIAAFQSLELTINSASANMGQYQIAYVSIKELFGHIRRNLCPMGVAVTVPELTRFWQEGATKKGEPLWHAQVQIMLTDVDNSEKQVCVGIGQSFTDGRPDGAAFTNSVRNALLKLCLCDNDEEQGNEAQGEPRTNQRQNSQQRPPQAPPQAKPPKPEPAPGDPNFKDTGEALTDAMRANIIKAQTELWGQENGGAERRRLLYDVPIQELTIAQGAWLLRRMSEIKKSRGSR